MELIPAILRLLQLLWTLLVTALIGNVIASNINGHEAAINFSMFVAVLSWLAVLYGLVATFVESIAIPVALMALDGAATLFTFIAGVVLAAKLKATNCGGDLDEKKLGSGWIGFGSANDEKRCREIQASTVFFWFLFATFIAGIFFTFMGFRRPGGSIRSSGPHMSQVRV